MKTISVNLSQADYEWLQVKASQHQMTVAQMLQEMIRDASDIENQRRNSVARLQAFVKQPLVVFYSIESPTHFQNWVNN